MWFRTIFIVLSLLASVAYASPFTRIVNGTDSDITRFPFVVSLRVSDVHNCGGSIVTPKWILTAAHCVYGHQPFQLSVQYGLTKITHTNENVVQVEEIFMHERYDDDAVTNDIALLKLSEELVYDGKTVGPVTLPTRYFEIPQRPQGVQGVLIGWGLPYTDGETQTHLQEAQLKIYSDEQCFMHHYGYVNSNNLCAGLDEGGRGQCTGDSGGPLLYRGSTQLGIVSWSWKPCGIALPGVFTKVSHYIDWINKHVK